MVELGINEEDTFEICKKYKLLSPLYELGIKRDGCWFCPNCAKNEIEMLKNNHPELVDEIFKMIEMCDYDLSATIKGGRNRWLLEYVKQQEEKKFHQVSIVEFLESEGLEIYG